MSIQRFNKEPVWRPNEESGEIMKTFIKTIEQKYKLKFSDYHNFFKWTVENIEELWAEIWDFFGVIHSKSYDQIVDLSIPLNESPKWFEGAKVNIAENLLKFRDDHTAFILAGEDREVERVSYKHLYEETRRYAAALRKIGLQKGDRVACYMSNRKEAVVAMLAVTGIGAIWGGGLPTFGPKAYLNRLQQVNPKVLFTIDQFSHNKEIFHLLKNIKEISEGLPSLEKVIIVAAKPESKLKNINDIKNSCFLDDFLKTASDSNGILPEMEFEQVSFSHPVYINFTSGTTGLPKTIVHGSGGLLTGLRDFGLHWNGQRKDVWLSMSPVGWVSWNALNYALSFGCTIVLFEGVPFFLNPTYVWDMVDNFKISNLFLTPAIMDEMERRNYFPTNKHHLRSLKTIGCSGGVAKSRNYDFAFKIKRDVHFAVAHGSTEMMGFCMICDDTLPVYAGEMSSPCLGTSIECCDEKGNFVFGEMGEFLITKPVPSLPLGFWGDTSGDLFKKTYFSKYPGAFAIGDAIIINPVTKGIIVCGRSDETIKQRGCRFGSSEIYNVVKMIPEVQDSLCVGQLNKNGDERAVLFLLMKEGHFFSKELVQTLRKLIAEELTERHMPDVIIETPGIPYNANGKKTEIIIKKIINSMPHNPETVANSECLKFYYDVPELQGF